MEPINIIGFATVATRLGRRRMPARPLQVRQISWRERHDNLFLSESAQVYVIYSNTKNAIRMDLDI